MYHVLCFFGVRMLIQDLVRRCAGNRARLDAGRLAEAAGLSRNTLNRLENGLFPDLGVKKAEAILEKLDMELVVEPISAKAKQPDFIGMACTNASVSFKQTLTPMSSCTPVVGKADPDKEAHFIALIEEAPASLLSGLIQQVGKWAKPGKVEKNSAKIAEQLGVTLRGEVWPKTA